MRTGRWHRDETVPQGPSFFPAEVDRSSRRSLPLPPLSLSMPSMPPRTSRPRPPQMRSPAPRPWMMSFPSKPTMTFCLGVPVILLSPGPPTMVADPPKALWRCRRGDGGRPCHCCNHEASHDRAKGSFHTSFPPKEALVRRRLILDLLRLLVQRARCQPGRTHPSRPSA